MYEGEQCQYDPRVCPLARNDDGVLLPCAGQLSSRTLLYYSLNYMVLGSGFQSGLEQEQHATSLVYIMQILLQIVDWLLAMSGAYC